MTKTPFLPSIVCTAKIALFENQIDRSIGGINHPPCLDLFETDDY